MAERKMAVVEERIVESTAWSAVRVRSGHRPLHSRLTTMSAKSLRQTDEVSHVENACSPLSMPLHQIYPPLWILRH